MSIYEQLEIDAATDAGAVLVEAAVDVLADTTSDVKTGWVQQTNVVSLAVFINATGVC